MTCLAVHTQIVIALLVELDAFSLLLFTQTLQVLRLNKLAIHLPVVA